MNDRLREQGRASIRLDLSDGQIRVRHGDSGRHLLTLEVKQGAWSSIWKTIMDQSIETVVEDSR